MRLAQQGILDGILDGAVAQPDFHHGAVELLATDVLAHGLAVERQPHPLGRQPVDVDDIALAGRADRQHAGLEFFETRLEGLGIGVVAGGLVIGTHAAYRLLFLFDALSYLALLAFVIFGTRETLVLTASHQRPSLLSNWLTALKDKKLALYALLNLIFTNNVLQMSSTLPIYISRLPGMAVAGSVAVVFSYYIILVSLLILPISRKAASAAKTKALMLACLAWLSGQLLTALLPGLCSLLGLGSEQIVTLLFTIGTVSILAFANALYSPAASSLVVELAPANARATYLSVNSLCWGLAGTVGPAVGLTIIDKGARPALLYWFALALLNAISIAGLWTLKKLQDKSI